MGGGERKGVVPTGCSGKLGVRADVVGVKWMELGMGLGLLGVADWDDDKESAILARALQQSRSCVLR